MQEYKFLNFQARYATSPNTRQKATEVLTQLGSVQRRFNERMD